MKCAEIFESKKVISICETCSNWLDCYLPGSLYVIKCCDYVRKEPAQAGEVKQ